MVEREPPALEREEGNLGKRFPLLERERPPLEREGGTWVRDIRYGGTGAATISKRRGGSLMRAETSHYKR